MRTAYQYKILPTKEQRAIINDWLNKLRCQYNYLLGQRFSWWSENRHAVNSCPIFITHLPELKDKPTYYGQKKSLVQLKKDRPWYAVIYSQVLQNMVERVRDAFNRWIVGDSNGNRSGKPRFKGKGRYRTFTYPQAKDFQIESNKITLPKIGKVKVIFHRPIPEGFTIKTVSVTKKADGYYISFSLEDTSVPEFISDIKPTNKNSIGIDLGLEKYVTTSNGVLIAPPKYFRKSQDKLAKLQRKAAARKKGTKARKKLNRRVAKLHQKIARSCYFLQRKDFHYITANKLLNMAEVVFVEDLTISNMMKRCKPKQDEIGSYLPNGQSAKSGLNKSFADAGLGNFVKILENKAEKAGLKVIKVDPTGTSQHCCNCLNRVSKELDERWNICSNCGTILDRDLNSADLIKQVGLGIASLKKAQPNFSREEKPTP